MLNYPEKPDNIWVPFEEANDKGKLVVGAVARHKCGGPDILITGLYPHHGTVSGTYYNDRSGKFEDITANVSHLLFRIV